MSSANRGRARRARAPKTTALGAIPHKPASSRPKPKPQPFAAGDPEVVAEQLRWIVKVARNGGQLSAEQLRLIGAVADAIDGGSASDDLDDLDALAAFEAERKRMLRAAGEMPRPRRRP